MGNVWVDLPFVFQFHLSNAAYNGAKTRIFASVNGVLFFNEDHPAGGPGVTTAALTQNAAIAPKWQEAAFTSVTYSEGPASSFVRFRWAGHGDAVDALIYADGRIRFDYGTDLAPMNNHQTGIAKGAPFLLDNRVVETGPGSTHNRASYLWKPAVNAGPTFGVTLDTPEPGSIYVDSTKSPAKINSANYATVSGPVPLRARATGAVGSVTLNLYVGTEFVGTGTGTGTATVTATWTPPPGDFALYTVRAIAITQTDSVETYRDIFATADSMPIGEILTPSVTVLAPNGGEWIAGTDTTFIEWATTSACPTYTLTLSFSGDDGRTFAQYESITAGGPLSSTFRVAADLSAFDSAETLMRASIAVPACGGNPSRIRSDTSDAEFVIDTNGRTVRIDAAPPAGTTINGYYTAPLGFDYDASSEAGFARIAYSRNGAAATPLAAYIDEFSTAGTATDGTHWRWTQTPAAFEDAIHPVTRGSSLATYDEPAFVPRQGPTALSFPYEAPRNALGDTAIAVRDLPMVTDLTGFDTAELWAYYGTNAETTGQLTMFLMDGTTARGILSATLPAATWTKLSVPLSGGTVDNLRVELSATTSSLDLPSVVLQEFILDGLRAASAPQEATDGFHFWKATVMDGLGTEASASEAVPLDLLSPVGGVVVAAGDLVTASSEVNLKISATDSVSGVEDMMLSNRVDFLGASWEPYAPSRDWTLGPLGPGENHGNRVVYAKFRDGATRVSPIYQDDILFDPTLPVFGTDYAPGQMWLGTASHTLRLDVADNVELNTSSARAGFGASDTSISYQQAEFSGVPSTGAVSLAITAPEGKLRAGFKIRDTAGNEQTATRELNVDLSPPVATINIVQETTNSREVDLVLRGSDSLSGVTAYRVGNAPGAGEWQAVTLGSSSTIEITARWTLDDQDGRRFVYVEFVDNVGHVSLPTADSVVLDRRGPLVTPTSPAPGATNVALSPRISASWQDDLSASTEVVGVEPLSGRMWIRDYSLDLPPVDVTGQATRTPAGITYDAALLRACAIHEVGVSVDDQLGNPSVEVRWLFRTTGCP